LNIEHEWRILGAMPLLYREREPSAIVLSRERDGDLATGRTEFRALNSTS
jgi:hypothetical protein